MASEQTDLPVAAREAILKRVAEQAPSANATALLKLAEAYAWAVSPNNAHGGSSESK